MVCSTFCDVTWSSIPLYQYVLINIRCNRTPEAYRRYPSYAERVPAYLVDELRIPWLLNKKFSRYRNDDFTVAESARHNYARIDAPTH